MLGYIIKLFYLWENEHKRVFPKKFPTVEQFEKYIEKRRQKLDTKNTKYNGAD